MFSARVLDHFYNPRNTGPLEGATHQGTAGIPGDGPYVELWLLVQDLESSSSSSSNSTPLGARASLPAPDCQDRSGVNAEPPGSTTSLRSSSIPARHPTPKAQRPPLVLRAAYRTYGCPAAVACASLLCELAIGREVERLLTLTPDDLVRLLGGLPEGKEECPRLALQALASAFRKETER